MALKDVSFKIENNVLIGMKEPIEEKSVNIGELVLNALKSRPDFIGQVDALTGEQTTYKQMRERSVKCALWLKKQDVKPGDIIVTCTYNNLNACIPYLASLYIGAIPNPWNEQSSKATMEFFIKQIVPKVIFVNENKAAEILEIATKLRISAKIVVFGELEGFVSLESILNERFHQTEIERFSCVKLSGYRDTAVILFSSGTTGDPKGVELVHGIFTTTATQQGFDLSSHHIALWFGSLSWITSVVLTVRCILLYVKAIKFAGFDSEKVCQTIEKYKVSWVLFETSMCNRLLRSYALERYNVSSLKNIVIGGSVLSAKVHKDLIKAIPNSIISTVYGMTELGFATVCQKSAKIRSSGHVLCNVRIMFVDLDTGKPLGPNVPGEIWCKTSFMMNGYYKNPEVTAKTIDSDGWLHTGDVGYYDEDGHIFVDDRIKELIKYRGHHVSPAKIETLLQTHPSVFEVAVMGVPHELDSEHPIAFVTKLPGTEVTQEKLQQLVEENLEDYNQLRGGVVFMNEMPRVANGKIDRKHLRNLAKTYAKAR